MPRKNVVFGSSSNSGINVYQDDRINRLSQRLSSIHNGLDVDRSSKYTDKLLELELDMRKFDEEMNAKYQECVRKLNETKELVLDIQTERQVNDEYEYTSSKYRENGSTNKAKVNDRSDSRISQMEKRINELLQTEILSRKTMEQRLVDIIDDRLDNLRKELLKKDSERQELDNCVRKFVDVDIPRLGNAIKNEIESCKLTENTLKKQIDEEVGKLNSLISDQVAARQHSIDALLDLMESLVQRITIDSKADRTERQNSEDTLLNLLGETLNRVKSVASSIINVR